MALNSPPYAGQNRRIVYGMALQHSMISVRGRLIYAIRLNIIDANPVIAYNFI